MTQPDSYADATRNLQRYLRQLSFADERIPAPPVDGIFAEDTRRSLSAFQQTQGLPVTGVGDPETFETLFLAYRASLAENAPPREIIVFPREPKGFSLGEGDRNFVVTVVQFMLRELERLYPELSEVRVDGIFGPITEEAVRVFQSRNALPESGRVDLLTWNALADQHNLLAGVYPVE